MARRAKRAAVYFDEKKKFKSHFEKDVIDILPEGTLYETEKLEYIVSHKYNPDFKLAENVYLEAKGFFDAADRSKHLHIKKQHPEVKVYFIFMNPNLKLNRASKTTYADWCDKNGFEHTTIKKGIPQSWIL